jgi:hypothetical protein
MSPHATEPLDDRVAEQHWVFRGRVQILPTLGPTVPEPGHPALGLGVEAHWVL